VVDDLWTAVNAGEGVAAKAQLYRFLEAAQGRQTLPAKRSVARAIAAFKRAWL
jgi:hypothetical protein